MDKLQACAQVFYNLLDIQYKLKVGRKGHLFDICISFSKEDFHHLLGLQKLKDNDYIRTTARAKIFDRILDGTITYELMQKSVFFPEMASRIDPFLQFESFLDSNDTIFSYLEKNNNYSIINADYLMLNLLGGAEVFLFLSKCQEGDADTYFCRTFFPKTSLDYTTNQSRYTLLYKEKVNMKTGACILQFDKSNNVAEKKL